MELEGEQLNQTARLAWTEMARKNLMAFILASDPSYDPSKVHTYITNKLQAVAERGDREVRLCISIPPQHGKSRAVCEEFVSWLLGQDPTEDVVICGYNQELPVKSCKRVRNRLQTSTYQQIFPNTQLSEDTRTQNNWTTTAGGGVRAVGIGSGLTGNRASTLIIDDPHKDRHEADSATYRNRIWDWFTSTAVTRLTPNSLIILIMTRWHEEDLVGMLTSKDYVGELEDRGFEDQIFEVINFPALCENESGDVLGREEGEALWEQKDSDFINKRRAVLPPYEFNALYRGNPISRGGNIVDLSNIQYCTSDELPEGLELVRAWDLATSSKQTSDFSAGALCGLDHATGNFYVVHLFRKRMNWNEIKRTINSYGDREGGRIGVEAVGGFITSAEQIREERMGKNIVQPLKVTTDKLVRANPWLALVDGRKFFLVRGEWNYDFEDELRAFPDGKNDDQVDAVSLCWQMSVRTDRLLIA